MRSELLGIPFDILSFDETIQRAVTAMERRELTQHVALNAAKLVNARHDPVLRRDVVESHIIGIDGMGIVLAARMLGMPVRERVAGVDLMDQLLQICADKGFRPFLLGAKQHVLEKAAIVANQRWPNLDFAGLRNGYFEKHQEPDVVRQILESRADCLFIGMPTPRKERFLHRYRNELGVPFIMGVGGSLDILAGHTKRAPVYVQKAGLEWFYRIYQEPKRMWWRYARTNTIFAGLLAKAMLTRLFASSRRPYKIKMEG